MQEEKERRTLNISRYSSRRLYNTGAGEYVTVDDLAKYIREGYDIKVTDKKSGEDITSQILLQIIADQESKEGSALPASVLTDIVRSYQTGSSATVMNFLSESFEMLKGHRKKLSDSLLDQITHPLDPKKAMNSFEALREAQKDIVNSVLSPWMPGARGDVEIAQTRGGAESEGLESEDAVTKTKASSTAVAADEAALSVEVKQLREQMKAMEAKLESLQGRQTK